MSAGKRANVGMGVSDSDRQHRNKISSLTKRIKVGEEVGMICGLVGWFERRRETKAPKLSTNEADGDRFAPAGYQSLRRLQTRD